MTITVGAILGREAAELLGWDRLMRVAEPLHARGPLERAASLLQRGGWRAVFTARLIPGLRVYTTQVAGVSRMPLRTFLAGLLPANAVYIAGFVGLGAAFGRPILALIQLRNTKLLIALLASSPLSSLFLLARAPARRTLASLQAAGWTGPLRFSLDSVSVVLILACLGLNFAGHAIAVTFGLPLFLDSIGTVLAGVVGGPWVGRQRGIHQQPRQLEHHRSDCGALRRRLLCGRICRRARAISQLAEARERLGRALAACFAIASLGSTPLNFLVSGGKSGVGLGDRDLRWLAAAYPGSLPPSSVRPRRSTRQAGHGARGAADRPGPS